MLLHRSSCGELRIFSHQSLNFLFLSFSLTSSTMKFLLFFLCWLRAGNSPSLLVRQVVTTRRLKPPSFSYSLMHFRQGNSFFSVDCQLEIDEEDDALLLAWDCLGPCLTEVIVGAIPNNLHIRAPSNSWVSTFISLLSDSSRAHRGDSTSSDLSYSSSLYFTDSIFLSIP